jgi:hypothetical protein
MQALAPDSDPGFTGMTEWNMDTFLFGSVLSFQKKVSSGMRERRI